MDTAHLNFKTENEHNLLTLSKTKRILKQLMLLLLFVFLCWEVTSGCLTDHSLQAEDDQGKFQIGLISEPSVRTREP